MTTTITAGPSKFDLMLALFDRKEQTREIKFTLAGSKGHFAIVVITGVEMEDGSGESWLYKGWLRTLAVPGQPDFEPSSRRNVEGWYHTTTRNGSMRYAD